MAGLSRHQGVLISNQAHLQQSIEDILTTPIGSRVLRRDYGSSLYELMDKPMTPALKIDLYAAAISALRRWEPRAIIERVVVSSAQAGHMVIGIIGRDIFGQPLSFEQAVS